MITIMMILMCFSFVFLYLAELIFISLPTITMIVYLIKQNGGEMKTNHIEINDDDKHKYINLKHIHTTHG
jgi:hypothetical protein